MSRLARRSPTPAAVLSYVVLGMLATTYALISWEDALLQAEASDGGWPLDPGSIARLSLGWALPVTLMCAVVWVAALRQSRLGHPWRVPVAVAAGVAAWCLVAWRSIFVSYQVDGWYVPWPGPVSATAYVNDPTDPWATGTLAVRPGALTPVLLVVAVAAVAWSAHRYGRLLAVRPRTPLPRARTTALVVLGAPTIAAVAAATALQADEYLTATQRVVAAVVSPGAGLVLAVVAALALSGSGRAGWVLLAVVHLAVVGPLVASWWEGGADDLLATTALATLAVALAAAVHPVAMAVSRLDDPGHGGPTVPEAGATGARPDEPALTR